MTREDRADGLVVGKILRQFTRIAITLGLAWGWVGQGAPVWAQSCDQSPGVPCLVVLQSVTEVAIPQSALLAVASGATSVSTVDGARFGVLRFDSNGVDWQTVFFSPTPDFWSVGLDRLTVRTDAGVGTLLLVAADYRELILEDDFENGLAGTLHDPDGRLTLDAGAAFDGLWGIRIMPNDDDAWLDVPTVNTQDGEGQQGQRTEVGICPPEGAGPPGEPNPSGDPIGPTFTVLEGRAAGGGAYTVTMRRQPGGFGIRTGSTLGAVSQLPEGWVAVGAGPHRMVTRWWNTADNAGLQVLVDDRLLQSLALPLTLPQSGAVDSIRVGMVGTPPLDVPVFDFDALKVSAGAAVQGMTPVRVDDFEDAVLDGWALISPARLTMVPTPAKDQIAGAEVVGDWHLMAALPVPALVLDDSPDAAQRFALRFWLDARALSGPANGSVKILDVRGDDNQLGGPRHLKLSVAIDEDGKQSLVVRALAAPVTGTWVVAAAVPLAAGVGSVVVEWRRAYEVADTGYVRLWLDGAVVTELAGLANQAYAFGSYRLGAISATYGMLGAIGFDNLVAWTPTATIMPAP